MKEYRITKYNPANRNELGHYLDGEEWTCFSEVGKKVSLENYEAVEKSYIDTATDFLTVGGVKELQVVGLENNQNNESPREGAFIKITQIGSVIRSVLRDKYWCRLESTQSFVHIGWDYYLYLGVKNVSQSTKDRASARGLYVECFMSPYHTDDN